MKRKLNKFTPNDIILRDDACHIQGNFGHVETWYYDALFTNNYSMVSLINVIHFGRIGLVLTGLFIYKNSRLIQSKRRSFPLRSFYGSEEIPLIKINEQEIITCSLDHEKKWITHLHREEKDLKVDLAFEKNTKGFRGKTCLGDWLVIPQSKVTGTIFLNDNTIPISGWGYHDHNIYPLSTPFIHKGYYFGKFGFDSIHFTWARILKKHNKDEYLAVLNKNGEYFLIPTEHIEYTVYQQVKDHGKMIPTSGLLHINNDIIETNVHIEPIHYHHIGILAAHYWRYHVRYTGYIRVGSTTKRIDTIDITEYLKFF